MWHAENISYEPAVTTVQSASSITLLAMWMSLNVFEVLSEKGVFIYRIYFQHHPDSRRSVCLKSIYNFLQVHQHKIVELNFPIDRD